MTEKELTDKFANWFDNDPNFDVNIDKVSVTLTMEEITYNQIDIFKEILKVKDEDTDQIWVHGDSNQDVHVNAWVKYIGIKIEGVNHD